MLMVNRKENANRMRFSEVLSLVNLKEPRRNTAKQPIDAEVACKVVRSQGIGNCSIDREH